LPVRVRTTDAIRTDTHSIDTLIALSFEARVTVVLSGERGRPRGHIADLGAEKPSTCAEAWDTITETVITVGLIYLVGFPPLAAMSAITDRAAITDQNAAKIPRHKPPEAKKIPHPAEVASKQPVAAFRFCARH